MENNSWIQDYNDWICYPEYLGLPFSSAMFCDDNPKTLQPPTDYLHTPKIKCKWYHFYHALNQFTSNFKFSWIYPLIVALPLFSHAFVDFLIRGSAESSVSPRQCIISFLPPPLHGVGAGLDGQDFTCAECLSRAALSTAFLPAPVTPIVTGLREEIICLIGFI